MKRRTILFYTAVTVAFATIVSLVVFTFLNVGNFEKAFAASNFSSGSSGAWTTNSTWSGGSAPATSNITSKVTVNGTHNVTSTTLDVGNNANFDIKSNGSLFISGNLVVNNNFTLTVAGTLTVTGDLITKNNSALTINGGGLVKVNGNASFNNNAVVSVNGNLTVGGAISFGSNQTFNGSGLVSAGSGCNYWSGTGSCSLGTLPIKLLSFDAANTDGKVTLTWKTASEENNDFFTIERTSDGTTFESIGTVAGGGTTTKVSSYEFDDNNPISGRSYYRLSQTDFGGKTETFPAITVEVTNESASAENVQIYPNPLTGSVLTVSIADPKDGSIEVIDGRGNSIFSQTVSSGENSIELFLNENLTPGVYFVNYKAGAIRKAIRLIKK